MFSFVEGRLGKRFHKKIDVGAHVVCAVRNHFKMATRRDIRIHIMDPVTEI